MIRTAFGVFDGCTWEDMCQKCFKLKYESCGYQEMEASPGDFGIEGFTRTGIAFQCYCPDQEYTKKELYDKIRDKITKDLNKLKLYQKQLQARLSSVKISEWHFITPNTNKNELLAHIATKRKEVQGWNLPILTPNFDIQVLDIDFIAKEIAIVQSFAGTKIEFDLKPAKQLDIDWTEKDQYVANIDRKNKKRLAKANIHNLQELNGITLEHLTQGDERLKRILHLTPDLYFKISKIFNQYELEVKERCLTWTGDAEELLNRLKQGLDEVLQQELSSVSFNDRRSLVSHIVSKWIALCPIDFSEQ